MKYCIDTSALLDAWRRRYPPDVFPGVWRRFEELVADGQLCASEEVLLELQRRDDDVHRWAHEPRAALFVPLDDSQQFHVTAILAAHERLVDTRRNRSGADPFVIALAVSAGATVVTAENPTGKIERPNIPDVCSALDVPCVGLLEMFRQLGWRFG